MAFCGFLRQSTTVTLSFGPFLDDDDALTEKTGLTIADTTLFLSKNGAAKAAPNDTNDFSEDANGVYRKQIDGTDTGTLGLLTAYVHESDALYVRQDYQVVTQQWWDSMCSTDKLQVHTAEITAGLIANASFNADVGSTAHGTNIIALAVRKILEELNLDHLLKVDTTVAADGDLESYVVAGTVMAHLMAAAADATAFKASTDSLQGIRDSVALASVVPRGYIGDYEVDDTVYFLWKTNVTPSVAGTIKVYKNDSEDEVTPSTGITDDRTFDSLNGVYSCVIDLSANSFYAKERDYTVVLTGATIDGQSVDIPIASFSIENRYQGEDWKRDV